MNKKPVYIKCPRCELNYIEKKQKLCNICKAELNQPTSFYNTNDDDADNLLELCPVCKANYISLDDDVCEKCRTKSAADADPASEDEDEKWRSFLDDETEDVSITTEDGIEISLSKLEEEELSKDFSEDDDFFPEEEEEFIEEEEFEDDFEELDELDDDEDFDEDEEEDE